MTTNNLTTEITVSSIPIKIIRKAVKHMQLAVYPPEGEVRVTAPSRYTEDNIRLAIVSRLPWIKQQREQFKQQARQTQREMVSGETHYLWGKPYELRVNYQKSRHELVINGQYLDLSVHPETSVDNRKRVLSEYYRAELKRCVPELLEKWETQLAVKANDWGIRRMKTKWGSCSVEAKRIWLNLELAKKPLPCVEYVVVHELVHLIEPSHNTRFQALMNQYLPQWQTLRKALNGEHLAAENWKE